MRTAAAAAIVFVVAGGGWGVYTRVQQVQPSQGDRRCPRGCQRPDGFSSAGAMRTPETLPGPTALELRQAEGRRSSKAAKKPVTGVKPVHAGQPNAAAKATSSTRRRPSRKQRSVRCIYASFTMALINIPSSASTTAPQNAGPESVHMKSGHDGRRHEDHDAVDHQQEDSQSQICSEEK